MDIYQTWYGLSIHNPAPVSRIVGQIRTRVDPGKGHHRSMIGPFSKELFLQSGRLQQQTECIAMI